MTVTATLLAAALAAQEPVTTRLEGVVADGRGRLLPTAVVQVERDGVELGRTVTDGSGAFALGRLPPGPLLVRATTGDRAGAELVQAHAPREVVRIGTWPTRTLQVLVRDSDGQPVGGAAVVAAANGEDLDEVCTRGVTDAAGRCTLRNVVIGSADVRALAGPAPMATATVDGVDDGEVELAIPAAPQRRVCVALEGATPAQIAAARLVLRCEDASRRGSVEVVPMPAQPLRLLPDGTLAIDWLPEGVRVVINVVAADGTFAVAGDFVPPFVRKAEVRLRAEACAPVRLHLSEDGRPLAGMSLLLWHARTSRFVTTDAHGDAVVQLPQPAKKLSVRLLSREWTLLQGEQAEVEDDGLGGNRCELRAARRAVLTGRVCDAAGTPAPGTLVAVERGDDGRQATACYTAVDGTFSTWVPAKSAGLVLSAHGPHGQTRIDLPPARPDGSRHADITLGAPNIATGSVVDHDGKPVAGARVQVSGAREDSTEHLVTERDGSFALVGHDAGNCSFDVRGTRSWCRLGSGVTVLAPLVIDR